MQDVYKIAILGAGESGTGAAILALKEGMDVFVSDRGKISDKHKSTLDSYGIAWEEGAHSEDRILAANEIVKSPGIPDSAPLVVAAMAKGIPVVSELEFAYRFLKGAKLVCITGANGKTTTTMLIYSLLQKAGLNVGLAGNVGFSFARQVAECNFDYYVLEISSFQLDNMYQFKADIAIITNITPDHLDRYQYKFENYINSKFRILQNMQASDVFIFSADCPVLQKEIKTRCIAPQMLGATITNAEAAANVTETELNTHTPHNNSFTMNVQELALAGKHNLSNSLVAALTGKVLNIKNDVIRECLTDFKGVEHRLQKLAFKVRGVQFINDSKATNVNSVWYALDSMQDPTVWIAGGVDKGNDYSELYELVGNKVKALVCLGTDNSKLIEAFGGLVPVFDTHSMEEAVETAYAQAVKGDTVLLSPACASFDLFENYEDRGRQFSAEARRL